MRGRNSCVLQPPVKGKGVAWDHTDETTMWPPCFVENHARYAGIYAGNVGVVSSQT